jgi:hypothetical protein
MNYTTFIMPCIPVFVPIALFTVTSPIPVVFVVQYLQHRRVRL